MRHMSRKLWWLIGLAAFAVVVVVVVVPSVVVTRQKQQNNQANNNPQQPSTNNLGDPNTTSSTEVHLPAYSKATSPYANLTRIRTYNDIEKQKDRIFVIGDVHGCADELKQLVQKINYNPERDLIVLAGDLVYRGPDNVGVIRYAREIGAMCVRGNHDHIVIRFMTYELQHGPIDQDSKDTMPEGDVEDPLKFNDDHVDIVKNMTREDYDYLASCPLVIEFPTLNNSRVVHGGLDPAVEETVNNDPYWIVNMRNIDDGEPERTKSKGDHWADYWTRAQANATHPVNIYYGHDAGRGLDLEAVTFGTDSGCVYGKQLTALEMKTHNLTQIDCPEYSS